MGYWLTDLNPLGNGNFTLLSPRPQLVESNWEAFSNERTAIKTIERNG